MYIKFYVLILLLFTGCVAKKQSSSFMQQTDSLRHFSHLSIQSVQIPESRARLIVPSAKLKELPPGAAFVQKSGQATAEIRFLHDTLFVTASCDSLQNLVYQYEEEIAGSRASAKTSQKEQNRFEVILVILIGYLLLSKYFLKKII